MTTATELRSFKLPETRFSVTDHTGTSWSVRVFGFSDRIIDGKSLPETWCFAAVAPEWGDDVMYPGDFATAAEAEVAARKWFEVVDMGSLAPLDVGFDLRVQGMPVVVPEGGFLSVFLPPSKKYKQGRKVTGRRWLVVRQIKGAGFNVSSNGLNRW